MPRNLLKRMTLEQQRPIRESGGGAPKGACYLSGTWCYLHDRVVINIYSHSSNSKVETLIVYYSYEITEAGTMNGM